jgi:hypothetical protein
MYEVGIQDPSQEQHDPEGEVAAGGRPPTALRNSRPAAGAQAPPGLNGGRGRGSSESH